MTQIAPIHVVGGGLAGSEAAWQIAEAGVPVVLHEMRPVRGTDAHKTEGLAELVCSNSFRSDDAETNAVGLLHAEMRRLGSLIMRMGDAHQVPAGGALAVDRDAFSAAVTAALEAHPLVTIERGEVAGLPPADWDNVIIATGPLTSPALAAAIGGLTGEKELAFFDAIAPIVHFESIDMETAWFQSRYDKAGPAAPAPTTSTARWTATSTRPSSTRCWRRRRPSSRNGRARPISTAACPSRSWPSAAARRCAGGR